MDIRYQEDEEGNKVSDEYGKPIVTSTAEIDYCKCVHEYVKLPKNVANILEILETGKKLGYEDAINMLFAIEMYASICYDKTQEHLASIDSISSIEEIINYDYKSGYPEKLTFEL